MGSVDIYYEYEWVNSDLKQVSGHYKLKKSKRPSLTPDGVKDLLTSLSVT